MSFVTIATNLPSCFSIQFLEQLLKFLVNFTLLKYVKSQRSYGFLITKELTFGFQILDFKDHFSDSLRRNMRSRNCSNKKLAGLKSVYKGPLFYSEIIIFKPNGSLHKTNYN